MRIIPLLMLDLPRNGDWEVSANEMTMAFNDLALGLTRADLFAVIRRIMKRSTVDAALVVSPHEFVKVLAWHPRPSQGGIQNALEVAKSNREATAQAALQKAQDNPFPKPKPSFQYFRTEDAEEYRRLEGSVAELKRIVGELEKTFTFRNIRLELLAMSAEDQELRRQNAKLRLRERAAQTSEKTMFQLLDESRSRRAAIIADATRRARENRDAPQRYHGEPPPIEALLGYACKRDKDAVLKQVERNARVEAAAKKLASLSAVLGVRVRDLPMSAKERHARGEVLQRLREERRRALLGSERIAGQFIDDAKRNRKAICERALARVAGLKRAWAASPLQHDGAAAVFEWFERKARAAVADLASRYVNAPSGRSAAPVEIDGPHGAAASAPNSIDARLVANAGSSCSHAASPTESRESTQPLQVRDDWEVLATSPTEPQLAPSPASSRSHATDSLGSRLAPGADPGSPGAAASVPPEPSLASSWQGEPAPDSLETSLASACYETAPASVRASANEGPPAAAERGQEDGAEPQLSASSVGGKAAGGLSVEALRFGRKRDFRLLESLCAEAARLRLAVAHLEAARAAGVLGVDVALLAREARIRGELAGIAPAAAGPAAATIQRFCRYAVLKGTGFHL
jgi:hypothetical protein